MFIYFSLLNYLKNLKHECKSSINHKRNRRTMGKIWDSKNSQFPSIVNLFESKNDLKECNLFPEDYNKYNATKKLM
jgi:hypothetical protein